MFFNTSSESESPNVYIVYTVFIKVLCVCVCVHALQTKKRYAKEWAEAEKATQQAEKTENDLSATRLDVEKVNTHTLPSTTEH